MVGWVSKIPNPYTARVNIIEREHRWCVGSHDSEAMAACLHTCEIRGK